MKVSARSGVYVQKSWGRLHATGLVVCQKQRASLRRSASAESRAYPCGLLAVTAYCSQEAKKQQHYKDRIKCCAAGYGTARY